MGNFGSKEDILSEIEGLFKKMNSGKLTLDELEDLVSLSRELHERSVILRYKAFEEKVFGERPIAVEVPVMEEMQEEVENHEEIAEPIPFVEMEEEVIEEEEIAEDGPAFEIQVDTKDEPAFGFSLFGDEIENEDVVEDEKVVMHEENQTEEVVSSGHPIVAENELPTVESSWETATEIQHEFEQASINAGEDTDEESADRLSEAELSEQLGETQSGSDLLNESRFGNQSETETRAMSDIERAHQENLARFFNRSQAAPEAPVFEQTVVSSDEKEEEIVEAEVPEQIYHNETPEKIEEEVPAITSSFYHEEIPVAEPEVTSHSQVQEEVEEIQAPVNNVAVAAFVHKYNQVSSELAGSQFGLVKLDSLLGSFGLNERLQFINELFDGSSEGFSNAIKHLDQQASFEQARSKVAEYAVENSWDVDSETVVEFMQKIIRRYA